MKKTLVKIACFKNLDRFGFAPKASFHCEEKSIQRVTGKGYFEIFWVIVKVGSCATPLQRLWPKQING